MTTDDLTPEQEAALQRSYNRTLDDPRDTLVVDDPDPALTRPANDAAERLHDTYCGASKGHPACKFRAMQAVALAAERRATVERIRAALATAKYHREPDGFVLGIEVLEKVQDILDATAND